MSFELKVGTDFLELAPGGEDIILKRSAAQRNELKQRSGLQSYSITFPDTAGNRALLGVYPDSSIDYPVQGNAWNRKIECSLCRGLMPVIDGFLRIERFQRLSGEIDATFYADNVLWFELVKDVQLNELDFGTHILTPEQVRFQFLSNAVEYGIINLGLLERRESNSVALGELAPFVVSKFILQKIFEAIGWEVDTSELSDAFRRDVVQCNLSEVEVKSQEFSDAWELQDIPIKTYDQYAWTGAVPKRTDIFFVTQGLMQYQSQTNGGTVTATLSDTIPAIHEVENSFIQRLTYQITNIQSVYNLQSEEIIDVDLLAYGIEDDPVKVAIVRDGVLIRDEVEFSTLTAGRVAFQVKATAAVTFPSQLELTATLNVKASAAAIYPRGLIAPGQHLPDMTADKFLKNLAFDFNLLFQVVPNEKKVKITHFDNIEGKLPQAVDLTDRLIEIEDSEIDFLEAVSNYARRNDITRTNGLGNGVIDLSQNELLERQDTLFESDFAGAEGSAILDTTFQSANLKQLAADESKEEITAYDASDGKITLAQTSSLKTGDRVVFEGNGLGGAFTGCYVVTGSGTNFIFISDGGNHFQGTLSNDYVRKVEVEDIDPVRLMFNYTANTGAFGSTIIIEDGEDAAAATELYQMTYSPVAAAIELNLDSLAYDQFQPDPAPGNKYLLDTYYALTRRMLERAFFVRAVFKLDIVTFNNIRFDVPVYMQHPTLTGYYYVNLIDNFDGDTAELELLQIP